MISYQKIIDISQPVSEKSACFPGDTPFSRKITLTYEESQIINLTALTMSPHIGTHADAPVHINGSLTEAEVASNDDTTAGAMALSPFIGKVVVVDVAPTKEGIAALAIKEKLQAAAAAGVERVLFRTAQSINFDLFEDNYSFIETDTAELLGQLKFVLVGIDTPSVDHIRSKNLATHHLLHKHGLVWLENLDLTAVAEGEYFLIALPLKFMDLEATPVRAVLLT